MGKHMAAIVIVWWPRVPCFPARSAVKTHATITCWASMFDGLTLKPGISGRGVQPPEGCDYRLRCTVYLTPFLGMGAQYACSHLPTELATLAQNFWLALRPGGTSSTHLIFTFPAATLHRPLAHRRPPCWLRSPRLLTPAVATLASCVDVNPMACSHVHRRGAAPIALALQVNHSSSGSPRKPSVRVTSGLHLRYRHRVDLARAWSLPTAQDHDQRSADPQAVILHNAGHHRLWRAAAFSPGLTRGAARFHRGGHAEPACKPVWPPHTSHSIRRAIPGAVFSKVYRTFPVQSSPTSLPAQQRRRIIFSYQ